MSNHKQTITLCITISLLSICMLFYSTQSWVVHTVQAQSETTDLAHQAPDAPAVKLQVEPLIVVDEETVFTAIAHGTKGSITYMWDLGDGTVEITEAPTLSHIYRAPVKYDVLVMIQDEEGQGGHTQVQINATLPEPTRTPTLTPSPTPTPTSTPTEALIKCDEIRTTGPQQVEVGQEIEFTAYVSPSANDVGDYHWAFGDGSDDVIGSEAQVTHTYTEAGKYEVRVTVTNKDGSSQDYCTLEIEVVDIPPGGLTIRGDRSVEIGKSLRLEAVTEQGTGDIQYAWEVNGLKVGDTEVITHTFDTIGQHTVTASAWHTNTAPISTTATIDVSEAPPELEIYSNGTIFIAPTERDYVRVEFTANVKNSHGHIDYLWDFGDGNISNERTPPHAYNRSGNYVVIASATNSKYTATKAIPIIVRIGGEDHGYLPSNPGQEQGMIEDIQPGPFYADNEAKITFNCPAREECAYTFNAEQKSPPPSPFQGNRTVSAEYSKSGYAIVAVWTEKVGSPIYSDYRVVRVLEGNLVYLPAVQRQ